MPSFVQGPFLTRCLLIGLVCFLWTLPAAAAPVRLATPALFHYTNAEAEFYFTQDRAEHFRSLKERLELGLRRLQYGYGQSGLSVKPAFWLFGTRSQMQAAFDRHLRLSSEARTDALRNGIYRGRRDVWILYPLAADTEEILRLIFQEYGRRLLALHRKAEPEAFVGWFELGMTSYLAWYTLAEIEGTPQSSLHAELLKHYGLYFDPGQAFPLDSLETRREWEAAIRQAPLRVYGQSVLAYMYFSSLGRPWNGVRIFKRLKRTRDFPYEFQRISGLHLHEFEARLKKQVYPKVRKWRKENQGPRKKRLPIA